MTEGYFVSRQVSVFDGERAVEIAYGLANSSPDALARHYEGELETYEDPREAAEAAIRLAAEWGKAVGETIPITRAASGALGVYPCAADGYTPEETRSWAETEYAAIPKCEACGEPGQEYVATETGEPFVACGDMHAEEIAEGVTT